MTTPLPPPPPVPPRLSWVPTLDGLRGLAVLAVVAFHAGHLQGGYLGVDLFFTVSGFLITRLILDDLSRRRFRLGSFWARRARRLLPALWLLLAVLILCSPWLVERSSGVSLRRSVVATAIYIANWWQLSGPGSYWQAFGTPAPLNHTWSLAIEEQFYVIWPIIALIVWKVAKRPARALLALAVSPSPRPSSRSACCSSPGPTGHAPTSAPTPGRRRSSSAAAPPSPSGPAATASPRGLALAPPAGAGRPRRHRRRVVRRPARRVALPRRLPAARHRRRADPRQQRRADARPAQPCARLGAARAHRPGQLRHLPVALARLLAARAGAAARRGVAAPRDPAGHHRRAGHDLLRPRRAAVPVPEGLDPHPLPRRGRLRRRRRCRRPGLADRLTRERGTSRPRAGQAHAGPTDRVGHHHARHVRPTDDIGDHHPSAHDRRRHDLDHRADDSSTDNGRHHDHSRHHHTTVAPALPAPKNLLVVGDSVAYTCAARCRHRR